MALASLHDLPISNDPRAVLAQSDATRSGLPVAVLPIPGSGELQDEHHETPRILVAHLGNGIRKYRRSGQTFDLSTAPRMIEVYEAGLHIDHASWTGEVGRCVRIEFSDHDVCNLTHGELQTLRLRTRHEVFDDKISTLTLELAEALLVGGTAGSLYLQGLTLSILGLVSDRHAIGRALPDRAGTFTPLQRKRVLDLLNAEIASKISLVRIANEIGLSAHHFSRLFKATFLTTPHDFVLTLRIDAAERALRLSAEASISEVAMACGFSSQSHLTQAMRKRRGVTPMSVRKGCPPHRPGIGS